MGLEPKTIKIVVIGDGAVGKTSLLNRYSNDSFIMGKALLLLTSVRQC